MSGLSWIALSHLLPDAHGDHGLGLYAASYAQTGIRAFIPSVLFMVVARLLGPKTGMAGSLTALALAVLFAGGAIEAVEVFHLAGSTLRITALSAHVVGATVGLLIGFGLRHDGAKGPTEPTA